MTAIFRFCNIQNTKIVVFQIELPVNTLTINKITKNKKSVYF